MVEHNTRDIKNGIQVYRVRVGGMPWPINRHNLLPFTKRGRSFSSKSRKDVCYKA